jgi:hypothetical protein
MGNDDNDTSNQNGSKDISLMVDISMDVDDHNEESEKDLGKEEKSSSLQQTLKSRTSNNNNVGIHDNNRRGSK